MTHQKEADFNTWSNVANGDAYGYAKVTAEKMVTDYVTKTGGKVDAVSINPCVIAGPCMTKVPWTWTCECSIECATCASNSSAMLDVHYS